MSERYSLWATAGHVDHGKTALLRALTGIDADRLPEEKKRGITIDIGFAHFRESETTVSFIDVPGHEDFIKNMLAGVGGVDALMLVVAADESVKPQTLEHLRIASLLGIPRGIIALTKSDLADAETLAVAEEEIRAAAKGTFLEEAKAFRVSAQTGAGIAELKTALVGMSRALPPRPAAGLFRLPVDRVFTIKGFGTVVTGTALAGEVREGAALRLLPQQRDVRVRGIEVQGAKVGVARAGERTALNLQGVEVDGVARGDVLAEGAWMRPTRVLDAAVTFLDGEEKKIRSGTRIRFHCGAAEIIGRLTLREGGAARLRLEAETALAAGDRFVLRRYSPMETIGGGVVMDPQPQKAVSYQPSAVSANSSLATDRWQLAAGFVERAGESGISLEDAAGRLALHPKEAEALLAPTATRVANYFFSQTSFLSLRKKTEAALAAFHKEQPLRPGMPREALRRAAAAFLEEKIFDALLAGWEKEKIVAFAAEGVKLASHGGGLSAEEEKISSAIEAAFRKAGMAPPAPMDVVKSHGKRGSEVMHHLLRSGALVRVATDYVVHKECYEALLKNLCALAAKKPLFTVADFKDAAGGLSRKHAIPLLEYLDRAGITVREGDARRMKQPSAPMPH